MESSRPPELDEVLWARIWWRELGVPAGPPIELWTDEEVERWGQTLDVVLRWERAEQERLERAAARTRAAESKG